MFQQLETLYDLKAKILEGLKDKNTSVFQILGILAVLVFSILDYLKWRETLGS